MFVKLIYTRYSQVNGYEFEMWRCQVNIYELTSIVYNLISTLDFSSEFRNLFHNNIWPSLINV